MLMTVMSMLMTTVTIMTIHLEDEHTDDHNDDEEEEEESDGDANDFPRLDLLLVDCCFLQLFCSWSLSC